MEIKSDLTGESTENVEQEPSKALTTESESKMSKLDDVRERLSALQVRTVLQFLNGLLLMKNFKSENWQSSKSYIKFFFIN